jgi:hypothetical protein
LIAGLVFVPEPLEVVDLMLSIQEKLGSFAASYQTIREMKQSESVAMLPRTTHKTLQLPIPMLHAQLPRAIASNVVVAWAQYHCPDF